MVHGARYSVPRNIIIIYILSMTKTQNSGNIITILLPFYYHIIKNTDTMQSLMHYADELAQ